MFKSEEAAADLNAGPIRVGPQLLARFAASSQGYISIKVINCATSIVYYLEFIMDLFIKFLELIVFYSFVIET